MSAVSELCNLVAEKNEEICQLKKEIEDLREDLEQAATLTCSSSECTSFDFCDSLDAMTDGLENLKCELHRVKCDIERLRKEKDCLCAATSPDNDRRARLCQDLECRQKELDELQCELEKVKKEVCSAKCCPKSGPGQPSRQPQPQFQASRQCNPSAPSKPAPCNPSGPSQPPPQLQCERRCPNPPSGPSQLPPQSQCQGQNRSQDCLEATLREMHELRCELEALKRERALLVELVSKNKQTGAHPPPCVSEVATSPTVSEQIICELQNCQKEIASLRCELQEIKETKADESSCGDEDKYNGKAVSQSPSRRSSKPCAQVRPFGFGCRTPRDCCSPSPWSSHCNRRRRSWRLRSPPVAKSPPRSAVGLASDNAYSSPPKASPVPSRPIQKSSSVSCRKESTV